MVKDQFGLFFGKCENVPQLVVRRMCLTMRPLVSSQNRESHGAVRLDSLAGLPLIFHIWSSVKYEKGITFLKT